MRELHWHANAAEWGYVISGQCRTTLLNPDGPTEQTSLVLETSGTFREAGGILFRGSDLESVTLSSFSTMAIFPRIIRSVSPIGWRILPRRLSDRTWEWELTSLQGCRKAKHISPTARCPMTDRSMLRRGAIPNW